MSNSTPQYVATRRNKRCLLRRSGRIRRQNFAERSARLHHLLAYDYAIQIFHGFDLNWSLKSDDEYREHGFEQPADKSSSISSLNCYLQLVDVPSYAMRLIVSTSVDAVPEILEVDTTSSCSTRLIGPEIILEGLGATSYCVVGLAMNEWMNSVPTNRMSFSFMEASV